MKDMVICELMGKVKRLQTENEELRRSRLKIKEVIRIDNNHYESLMVVNIYNTEAGIIVEVSSP
jgi:hypothetical protein